MLSVCRQIQAFGSTLALRRRSREWDWEPWADGNDGYTTLYFSHILGTLYSSSF